MVNQIILHLITLIVNYIPIECPTLVFDCIKKPESTDSTSSSELHPYIRQSLNSSPVLVIRNLAEVHAILDAFPEEKETHNQGTVLPQSNQAPSART